MRFVLGLLAALFAVSAVPAQAVTTITYTLATDWLERFIGDAQSTYVRGKVILTVGQPVAPNATLTTSIIGNTLSFDYVSIEAGYSYRLAGNLTFDRDLGGSAPTDLNGLIANESAFRTAFQWDHLSYATTSSGFFRSLDQIDVRDLSVGAIDARPVFYEQFYTSAIPEPQIWALIIAGFGAVGLTLRTARGRMLHLFA